MELTMCEVLSEYGEITLGDERAKTGIILLQCPSPQLAEKTLLGAAGRWILRLNCDPATEQSELFKGLAERAEADRLTSLAVIGHAPRSLQNLSGLDLSERIERRNRLLSEAQELTIRSASCLEEHVRQHLAVGQTLALMTLFYHSDSGTLQIYGADNRWKAMPNAPAY